MPNAYWNKQVSPQKTSSGDGVKPIASGSTQTAMPERTAAWPGLPGKSGPDRSAGVPEEKVYAYAQGLRGGKEVSDGD